MIALRRRSTRLAGKADKVVDTGVSRSEADLAKNGGSSNPSSGSKRVSPLRPIGLSKKRRKAQVTEHGSDNDLSGNSGNSPKLLFPVEEEDHGHAATAFRSRQDDVLLFKLDKMECSRRMEAAASGNFDGNTVCTNEQGDESTQDVFGDDAEILELLPATEEGLGINMSSEKTSFVPTAPKPLETGSKITGFQSAKTLMQLRMMMMTQQKEQKVDSVSASEKPKSTNGTNRATSQLQVAPSPKPLETGSKLTGFQSAKKLMQLKGQNVDTIMTSEESKPNGWTKSTEAASEKLKLSSWKLPQSILNNYSDKKITKLFPWQLECLTKEGVLDTGKNLLYSAPTSAGKTLVAEILMIKRVLEQRTKAIIILPYVAVVREKLHSLKSIFRGTGIRVGGFMGSVNPPGGFKAIDVAVCTIEKANSLINRLLEEEEGLRELGTLVVDELHLIGDPSRGYLLELLLTKILYMSSRHKIQVIGMSATLPNLDVLAKWLKAELYTTEYRPVVLKQLIKLGDTLHDHKLEPVRSVKTEEIPVNIDDVSYLALETVLSGLSVLIFCPTKNLVESTANTIASHFKMIGDPMNSYSKVGPKLRASFNSGHIIDVQDRLRECSGEVDNLLTYTVSVGVCYHHAGLTYENRDLVESAFKQGILKVIVSTSTLAAGVNLPARRVIIISPLMFNDQLLDTMTYRQMCGRAGRTGIDKEGESILICPAGLEEKGEELFQKEIEGVRSALLEGNGNLTSALKRLILEAIASGAATTGNDVRSYVACTFLFYSEEMSLTPAKRDRIVEQCLEYLESQDLIRSLEGDAIMASRLGQACLASSFCPEDGIAVHRELERAQKCMVLEIDLHGIYLITPIYILDQLRSISWTGYSDIFKRLNEVEKRVAGLIGVNENFIRKVSTGETSKKSPKNLEKTQIHERFYVALALSDLVNEWSLEDVGTKYGLNKGLLQNLQQTASGFAGMVTAFCKKLEWNNMKLLLSQFQERLEFGVQQELVDLVRLDSVNGQRARILFDEGFENVVQLAAANPALVEQVLHKKMPFKSNVHGVRLFGKECLTEAQVAQKIVQEARDFIQAEIGAQGNIKLKFESSTDDTPGRTNRIQSDSFERDTMQPLAKVATSEKLLQNFNPVLKMVKCADLIPSSFLSGTEFLGVALKLASDNKPSVAKNHGIGAGIIRTCATSNTAVFPPDANFHSLAIYNGLKNIWILQWEEETVQLEELLGKIKKVGVPIAMFDSKEKIKCLLGHCGTHLLAKLPSGESIWDPGVAQWMWECDEENLNVSKDQLIDAYVTEEEKCMSNSDFTNEAIEAFYVWKVMSALKAKLLSSGLWNHFTSTEMPSTVPILLMEMNGLGLEACHLTELEELLQNQATLLEQRAYQLAGRQFNLASPKDIIRILSGLGKNIKSSGKTVLQKLDHPLARVILEWRKVTNALNKVILPFQLERNLETGRVHGEYSLTVTGRFAMKDPNLQNIPRDFDIQIGCDSKQIGSSSVISMRNAFVPCSKEFIFLAADYSQLELRILAHLSKEPKLLEVLNKGNDVFKEMASQLKKCPLEQVTSSMRQEAKGIVYGVIYGQGAGTLAQKLEIEPEEASEFIAQFMDTYPGLKDFIDKTCRFCEEKGYVETLSGRRRYLPLVFSSSPNDKAKAYRQAVNSQIQGSAADLVKMAMAKLHSFLKSKYPKSTLPVRWNKGSTLSYFQEGRTEETQLEDLVVFPVVNLHDELVFEVRESHLEEVAKILKSQMESCLRLDVKLPVVIKTGESWGNMRLYEIGR